MIRPKCNYCGSVNLRADRALAGKLICISCGKTVSAKVSYIDFKPRRKNRIVYYILLIILVIMFIILIG